MPVPSIDTLRAGALAAADHRSRGLGPYETAYDVRRGYDEPVPAPAAAVPAAPGPEVWMGRRRER